ncbi:MAG: iron-sulfur cluster carrier protein ApbC [Deltaproteobacteria bacterium]|nr:iron-sulfur cluster carrier protein ApbC [Deltaproteobacteria bacterium]
MNTELILNALKNVKDPEIGKDLVTLDMIKDIKITGSKVSLRAVLTTPACPLKKKIEDDIRQAVLAVPGVSEVEILMDAQVKKSATLSSSERLAGVKNIIAVASGKGGVGKSTVAVNLAIALSLSGARVGVLDTDIYGPSIPTLFGLKDKKPAVDQEKQKIIPLEKYGLKIMSIGFMMRENDAVMWRGPMIHKMLQQFLDDVLWGELDYLVLDLPPGTGDAQLSLSQLIPISGAVIVTTPQDVALADVVRGIAMFQQVHVPVLGVIENMSFFECPNCHHHSEIFSKGGGKKKAEEMKVNFLGELPLDIPTREGSDSGEPITMKSTHYTQSIRFKEIAQKIAGQLSVIQSTEPIKISL